MALSYPAALNLNRSTSLLSSTGLRSLAAILLSTGLLLGSSGSSSATALREIVTEATTTPTIAKIALGPAVNAVRVYTGEQAVTEDFFYLYVSRNGGAVQKVKMYRWQGRILTGAPGDIFSFGTSNGRTLTMAPLNAPAVLETISGATGTANCDAAGPPIWTPTAPHVVLPSDARAFSIDADGTARWIFVAEQSPTGAWSPVRAFLHSATRATKVRCNFANVAIANFTGSTLAITAPTGSTIGGASAAMTLPIPTVTGTSRAVDSVATLKAAIAAAVAGDEIVLATSGSPYALDAKITVASFVANQAAGNYGAEGIIIRGATGVRTDVVLTGNGSSENGEWELLQPGSGPTASRFASFKGLTFDFGAQAIQFRVVGGKYYVQDVLFKGGASATDQVGAGAEYSPLEFYALRSRCQDGSADLWNFYGDSGVYAAASIVRLIACEGVNAGAATDAQCVTTHLGLRIDVYGGTYSDAQLNVVANSATTDRSYLFFTTISATTRAAGLTNGVMLYGVNWLIGASAANISTAIQAARFSRVTGTFASFSGGAFRETPIVEHNLLDAGVGRGVFNQVGGASIVGNIFISATANEAILIGFNSGAQPSTTIALNTGVNAPLAYSFQSATMPAVFKSNAAKLSGTSVAVASGAVGAVVTGANNTLDPTVSPNYVAGTGDITNADAQLDSDYFPTAAGNCDGNGDTSIVDFVGDSDPWGFVLIYKSTRVSRGARDIPAIYADSVLQPDLF